MGECKNQAIFFLNILGRNGDTRGGVFHRGSTCLFDCKTTRLGVVEVEMWCSSREYYGNGGMCCVDCMRQEIKGCDDDGGVIVQCL